MKDPKFKDEVTYCLDNKIYELISSGSVQYVDIIIWYVSFKVVDTVNF